VSIVLFRVVVLLDTIWLSVIVEQMWTKIPKFNRREEKRGEDDFFFILHYRSFFFKRWSIHCIEVYFMNFEYAQRR